VDIIGAYGDEGIALLNLYGDDAAKLIKEYGTPAVDMMVAHEDDAIYLLKKGSPALDDWKKYIPEEFHGQVISGFDGDPVTITLKENVSIYRYWSDISGERGRWTTLNPNLSPEEARSLLALPNDNYAFGVTQFIIPEGTTVLVGKVAEQTSTEWSGAYAIVEVFKSLFLIKVYY
jgi:hypothetical protein